jgi:hypothetical protein
MKTIVKSESILRIKILAVLLLFAYVGHGQVTTWKAPDGFASEKFYSVKLNGVSVPVYDTPIAFYAVFDFAGKVTVEVNTRCTTSVGST